MRIWATLSIIMLTVVPITGGTADVSKAQVALEGESSVMVCPTCKDRMIQVGVIPELGFKVVQQPQVEQPIITEVAFEKMRDASLAKAFQPKWVISPDGTPRAITLAVTLDLLKPGIYTLSLSIQPKSAPYSPRLKLQVIYPDADLEVPAKLVIYREGKMFKLWSFKDDKQQLYLRETKGLAPLTGLRIQTMGALSGSSPVSGALDLKLTNGRIEAGELLKNVQYDLTGNFPLGITTGSLRFFSNELKEPKTMTFEVRTQLSTTLLIIAIALGLFASYIVRKVLTKKIDLAEARITGRKVAEQIQADIVRYADRKFREQLSQVLTDLVKKMVQEDVTEINEASKRASDSHNKAIESLKDLLKTAEQNCKAWGTALKLRQIPPSIQEIHTTMGKLLKDAGELLKAGDASGVQTILDELVNHGNKLKRHSLGYQEEAKRLLDALQVSNKGLPAPVQARFNDRMKSAPLKLDYVKNDASLLENSKDFDEMFHYMDEEYYALGSRLMELSDGYGRVWEAIQKTLKGAGQKIDDGLLNKLEETVTGFIQKVRLYAEDPGAAHQNLNETLNSVQTSWEVFFNGHHATSNIIELVKKQNFAEAAQELMVPSKGPSMLGKSVTHAVELPWFIASPRFVGGQGEFGFSPETISVVNPEHVLSFIQTPEKEMKWAQFWRWLILGVILTLYYFMAASQNYTGMWTDVWNAFLAAFAADFAIDGIYAKLKPKTG